MALMQRFVKFGKLEQLAKQSVLLTAFPYELSRSVIPAFVRKQFSTSVASNEKVYELRTYSIQPKDFKSFMGLTGEWFHLRTKHSKLIGYWMSELGGINEVVHIWEYDSLGHRAQVRQTLASDPEWVGNYFTKVLPFFVKQDNSVMKCFPGTTIMDPSGKGVYELKSFVANNTSANSLAEQLPMGDGKQGSVVGSFYNVIGITNIGHQLWYYPSIDDILSNKDAEKSSEDAKQQIHWFFSRVMMPAPFSPLQ